MSAPCNRSTGKRDREAPTEDLNSASSAAAMIDTAFLGRDDDDGFGTAIGWDTVNSGGMLFHTFNDTAAAAAASSSGGNTPSFQQQHPLHRRGGVGVSSDHHNHNSSPILGIASSTMGRGGGGGEQQRSSANTAQSRMRVQSRASRDAKWLADRLIASGRALNEADAKELGIPSSSFSSSFQYGATTSTGAMEEGGDGVERSGPQIDLAVDRTLCPAFLKEQLHTSSSSSSSTIDTGGPPTSKPLLQMRALRVGGGGSQQQQVKVPLKDPKNDFALTAAKGSETLRDHKIRKAERRSVREAVEGGGSSGIEMAIRGENAALTPEELAALQRRLQLERFRTASEEERRKMAAEENKKEAMDMRSHERFSTNQQRPPQFHHHRTERGAEAGEKKQQQQQQQASATKTEEEKKLFNLIQEKRKRLPIYYCRDELLRTIQENSVVVIQGETGSGKTTQIAQYLYEKGYSQYGLIGCTQPRRMAAFGVATRVAQEVGCPVGEEVGYAIRLEDVSSPTTKVKFLTEGVLLREVVSDCFLSKYSVVIMDEAHERSVNTDVLLGVMKKVLQKRDDFKLIVTSATMDVEHFSHFFGEAPIFKVPGQVFPVQIEYQSKVVEDYVSIAVLEAVRIHLEREPGDILIFMTGEDDVECTCELIGERLEQVGGEKVRQQMLILPCYSMLPSAQQELILAEAPVGKRKCIVATNIAETSLTIDGIRYVIDAGYHKCKVYKAEIGMNSLQVYPVSEAQANQRKGRAGRTAEGVCLRLYTEHQFFNELLPSPIPEIQRSSIDSVVLLLKSIGVVDVSSFDFIDPPPKENVQASLFQLWLLGAVDDQGKCTPVGRCMAEFPAEPSLSKTLLASCELGCAEECIAIAAVLSVDAKSIFAIPKGNPKFLDLARRVREKFFAPDSDHLTLLNIFQQFRSNGSSRAWAEEHYLNPVALRRACDIRIQFRDRLLRLLPKLLLGGSQQSSSLSTSKGRSNSNYHQIIDSTAPDGNTDLVRKCFCFGFFPQAARVATLASYVTLYTSVPCHLQDSSVLNQSSMVPDYVIYHDFVLTHKEFISTVTAVEPSWLIEASKGLYTVRVASNKQQKNLLAFVAARDAGAGGGSGGSVATEALGFDTVGVSGFQAALTAAKAKAEEAAVAPPKNSFAFSMNSRNCPIASSSMTNSTVAPPQTIEGQQQPQDSTTAAKPLGGFVPRQRRK